MQIKNCRDQLLDVSSDILQLTACQNQSTSPSASSTVVSSDSFIQLIQNPDHCYGPQPLQFLKQRTKEWFTVRSQFRVTGSTLYEALGLDTLKKQHQFIDRVCIKLVILPNIHNFLKCQERLHYPNKATPN